MSTPKHLKVVDSEDDKTTVEAHRVMLGRYELVSELGHGGMASVHLARTRGPAGFTKWFAIKQIHPHLAKDQRFVEMFLDEARIAASVDHPNVAQVLELGEANGVYFIAMEYLHGETLGRLVSRAYRQGDGIAPYVAAHLVAAAATGLHAAHDGKDAEGRPLDLVHRDVSPQNIFITFDGRVKVTDFGVAKASNRISKTQTGTAKGKVAYMAPEQALAGVVDRRTDVFALGVLLWECVTGRRLFKADTEAQSLLRITGGKVPKPSSFAHDCPKSLERIILRALSRRPEDRYPSAIALARDLEGFLSEDKATVRPRDIADLMTQLFGDTKHTRDQMLRVQDGPRVAPPPDESSLDDLPRVTSSPHTVPSSSVVRAVIPSQRPKLIIGAVALALVMGMGAVFLSMDGTGGSIATASVRVESDPMGARINLDGQWLDDVTPAEITELAAGDHRVRLELEGHTPYETGLGAAPGERVRLRYSLTPLTEQDLAPADVDPDVVAAAEPAPEPAPEPDAIVAAVEPEVVEPEAEPEVVEPVVAVAPPPVRRDRAPTPITTPMARRDPRQPAVAAAPGILRVVSLPYATVRVNGGPSATTPIANLEVPAGRVTLRYRHRGEGPELTKVVRVRSGQRTQVDLTRRQ